MPDRLDEILDRASEAAARRPGELIPPPAAPGAPPARRDDPLDAHLDRLERRWDEDDELQRKAAAFRAVHTDIDPARYTEIVRLQAATGASPEFINENLEDLRKQVQQEQIEKALARSPATVRFMNDAARAAAVKDDIASASQLEWWITGRWSSPTVRIPLMGGLTTVELPGFPELEAAPAWARAFMDGLREREFNFRAASAFAGDTSPENLERLEALRNAQRRGAEDYGANNVATQAFIGAFRNVAELLAEGAATLGGAAAGAKGATVTAGPEAAPAGAVVGGYAAGVAFDFFDNVGAVFMDLRDLKDEKGRRLVDDETAREYAFAASGIGAAVTGGLALKGAKMIPGFEKVLDRLSRRATVDALQDAAFARAANRFAKDWSRGVVVGASQMAIQAGVNQGALEVAEADAVGRDVRWGRVFDATAQGFKQGLVEMSLLAAWAPAHTYFERRGQAELAAIEGMRLQSMTETAVASRVMKEHPDVGAELAREAAREAGAVTHTYADVGAWTKLWQERGVEPGRAAADIVGDGGAAWVEAQETGRLAIPVETWLTRLQQTDVATALRQDVALSPEGRTAREQAEQAKQLEKLEAARKEGGDAHAAELAAIEAEYFGQLVRARRTTREAQGIAKLIRDAVEGMAAERGESPAAILERYPLVIRERGDGAARPARRAAVRAQLASGSVLEALSPEAKAEVLAAVEGAKTPEAARAAVKLAERGWLDSLTGAGNRAAFDDFASRPRKGVHVMVDVNSLTDINDLGHDQGDVGLRTIGTTLHGLIRSLGGKFFRYGGDEFAAHFETRAAAAEFERRAAEAMHALEPIAGGRHKLSVSIGFGASPKAADDAALRAKEQALVAGRGGNEGKLRKKLAQLQAELAGAAAEKAAAVQASIAEVQRKLDTLAAVRGKEDFSRDAFFAWDEAGVEDMPRAERTSTDARLEQVLARIEGGGEFRARLEQRSGGPTSTEAFKTWFGDSQVVDANGRPLVVLHGAPAGGFDVFATTPDDGAGANTGARTAKLGAFFTDHPATANYFASGALSDSLTSGAPQVYPVYLSLQRPLRPAWVGVDELAKLEEAFPGFTTRLHEVNNDPDGFDTAWARQTKREAATRRETFSSRELGSEERARKKAMDREAELKAQGFRVKWDIHDMSAADRGATLTYYPADLHGEGGGRDFFKLIQFIARDPAARQKLERLGYDGIIVETEVDSPRYDHPTATPWDGGPERPGPFMGRATQYIAFRPEQIKSATGNRGTFDPSDPSILAQGTRGTIEFSIPGSADEPLGFDISLLAEANESTAAHELGHWLGLVLGQLGSRADATERHRALYGTALEFMGYATHQERLAALRERQVLEGRRAAGETLSDADEARRKAIEAKEEKLSHGFELYLAEGKAPSARLAGVFTAFKAWMRRIYRSLEAVAGAYRERYGEDLRLSDDVRRMFDRLLAAEDATVQAEEDLGGGSMAAVLKDATPEEREQLERARAERRREAEEQLYRELVESDRRQLGEFFAEERQRVRDEVEAELDAQPVYRALRYLQLDASAEAGVVAAAVGEVPASMLDEHGRPWKLDRAGLLKRYSPEFVRSLPPRITAREGGVSADAIADLFGFTTGDEMVKALQQAPSRRKTVEAEVQQRMEDLYGRALLDDASALGEAAVEAQHTVKGVQEIVTRMRVLARRLRPELGARFRAIDEQVLAAKARELVWNGPLHEVSAAKYLRAERASARRALELAAKGKVAAAYDALETQLWNHLLWKEAKAVEARADKTTEYLRRYTGTKERARLGQVKGGYLEKIDALLDSIELRDVSRAEVARRREALAASGGSKPAAAAMLAWIEEQKAIHRDAVIPQRILDNLDRTRHWRDLSLAELEEIRSAVQNIAHLAHTKETLLGAKDRRARLAVLEEMRDRAIESYGIDPTIVDRNTLSFRKRALRLTKKLEAGVIKPEELILGLDGGREDGPFHRYLYQPIADAHARWQDLVERVQKPILAELDSLPDETKAYLRDHRFTVNGQAYTMEAALAVALNWGNASNRQKTVVGWSTSHAVERQGIRLWQGEKTAEEFLAQVDARPELWGLVQRVWNAFDRPHDADGKEVPAGTPGAFSMWDAARELEKAMTGLEPKKIPALAFTRKLPSGAELKLEGGYYPMVYDQRFSKQGAAAAEKDGEGKFTLFQNGYERAITPHGHLVERIESFHAPVELSVRGLFRHLTHATKDIAMREALINGHDIITDQRFRDLVQVTGGEEALRVLDKWVRDVANDMVVVDGGESIYLSVLNASRRGLTASVFTYNAAQALQNLAGFGNVLAKVDGKYLWQGIQEVASARGEKIAWVKQKSGEMRHRAKSFDRDVKERLHDLLGQRTGFARAQEVGLWALQATDALVAYPTWIAAYRQALAGGVESVAAGDDAAAVRHADSIVRRALGSGATKDLPALMRSPNGKMITLFYGFASAQLNQVLGAARDARVLANDGQRYKALRRLTRVYFSIVGGAVLAELLVGRGPSDYDDDGEITAVDWSKWIGLRAVFAPATLVPLLGTVVRSAESGRDASMIPYERVATDVAKVGRELVDVTRAIVDDDDLEAELGDLGMSVARAMADFAPAGGQLRSTLGYWLDENGEPTRDRFGQQLLGTTFGRQREGRLSQAIYGEE